METNTPEGDKPSRSRLEDEVLEILQRSSLEPGKVVRFTSKAQRERTVRIRQAKDRLSSVRLSSLHFLAGCLLLAVLAAIVDNASPFLGKMLALGSIGCLVWVFVSSFRSPRETTTKRWRGRDIDFRPPGSGWSDRFRGGPKPPKR